MKLKQIEIKNFRSIEALKIEIQPISGTYTYTMLGINESGKSNFLKALQLVDDGDVFYPQDFFDDTKEIEILLTYALTDLEFKEIKTELSQTYNFDKSILHGFEIGDIVITIKFSAESPAIKTISEVIGFNKTIFETYTYNVAEKVIKERSLEDEPLNLSTFFSEIRPKYFWKRTHNVTFWKSSPQYLISDDIDLSKFSTDPENISIPLLNCFVLAGITDISKRISQLNNPVSIQNLESLLSDKVSNHINKVWPEHPIRVRFKINNNLLSFLIEDKEVKYKAKTTSQRSDGFRQFISFLLTISAENFNQELENSILLLDEPETHLHPSAQINLKDELIKITQNENNNIVFFATHSNYMIDKENINRCYCVIKRKNHKTELANIQKSDTSYSEVNYEIFGVITNDYHNELYGYLEDRSSEKLQGMKKDKKWINELTGKTETVSLSKYIRNAIHHPENTSNERFSEADLKKSIDTLRQLKYGK